MKQEMYCELPNGFRFIKTENTLDILSAKEILLSRKKRNITSAVRHGDEATITRHVIECPFCRSRNPAYYRYVGQAPCVSHDSVTKWAEPQYSLFEDRNNKLLLNNIYNPKEIYMCPKCKQESRPFSGYNTIEFCATDKKLTMSCNSADLKGILSLAKAVKMKTSHIYFPLSETLEFNMRNGHSSIRFQDRDGNDVLVVDVTSGSIDWSSTALYKFIDTNYIVKRKLRKTIGWVYEGDIPFETCELSPINAVTMTRFVGFPRSFYDSIPYSCSDAKLNPSFLPLAKKIHREQDLPIILDNSSLPKTKSIRRMMFQSPGLFFYLPEVERLCEIIGDINYFTHILESSNSFVILSFLHQYPGTLSFLADYKNCKGTANLYSLMSTHWQELADYSLHYSAMSEVDQRRERTNWKHTKSTLRKCQGYSIPMPCGPKNIKDCSIDGFSFEWLRTKNDYIRTGNALNNCLRDWTPYSNPVVAVKRGAKVVAAIEILENLIVQAKASNNDPICQDEQLNVAYDHWKQRYALIDIPDCNFLDLDYED